MRPTRAYIGALLLLLVAACGSGDDNAAEDGDAQVSSTAPLSTSTTATPTTSASTTSAPTTEQPRQVTIDQSTPLSPAGIGPIVAGMSVRDAEVASGLELSVVEPEYFDGDCWFVTLQGQPDLLIRALSPEPRAPVADPRDGRIVTISIGYSGASQRSTTAGVRIGATEAEVRAAHGGAIEELPHDYIPDGAYLYHHPEDDPAHGIRYVVDGTRVVTSIDVGLRGSITAPEGCA